MKNWIMALGALTLVGSGCSTVVLEPLEGTQGGGGAVVPGATSGGGDGGNVAIAMRGGDVNWQPKSVQQGGLAPWKPDAIVLFFSTDAQECSDPVLAVRCTGAAPFWQAAIAIPPELYHPGLIWLGDTRISRYGVRADFDGTDACGQLESWGIGPAPGGTLEIVSNGSTSFSVKLRGNPSYSTKSIFEGDYTVQPCGAPLPFSPPTPALAIRGGDLPPDPTGKPPPDPDSLVVFFGTLPDTCEDPWVAADCTTAWRATFTLPLALQKPGVIALSDPAIAATNTVAVDPTWYACVRSTGELMEGTVEILTSDAGGLAFKVYRSRAINAPGRQFFFDGLYTAAICP